ITMGAPSCFVTTFRRNLENELPADTEQCPPDAIFQRLDHDDFLAALAPKPVIILAQQLDYFDVRGVREAYRRLKHLYRQFDAESAVSLHVGTQGHGIPQPARLAMYQMFCKAAGLPVPKAEPELTLEKEEDLRCTPEGQVAPLGSKSLFSLTAEKAKRLAKERGRVRGEPLKRAIHETLRLEAPFHRVATSGSDPRPPHFRILRNSGRRRYPKPYATTYAVETEPGVFAVTYRLGDESLLAAPPRPQRTEAILYVSHRSADEELRSDPLIKE